MHIIFSRNEDPCVIVTNGGKLILHTGNALGLFNASQTVDDSVVSLTVAISTSLATLELVIIGWVLVARVEVETGLKLLIALVESKFENSMVNCLIRPSYDYTSNRVGWVMTISLVALRCGCCSGIGELDGFEWLRRGWLQLEILASWEDMVFGGTDEWWWRLICWRLSWRRCGQSSWGPITNDGPSASKVSVLTVLECSSRRLPTSLSTCRNSALQSAWSIVAWAGCNP